MVQRGYSLAIDISATSRSHSMTWEQGGKQYKLFSRINSLMLLV